MQRKSDFTLIMAIIFWGILVGAMWYSLIVYFRPYLTHLPQSTNLITTPYGLHEENFWLILQPVLLLAMIAMTIFNWKVQARTTYLRVILVIYVIAMITAGIYFVPELMKFAESHKSDLPASEWLQRGKLWLTMGWIRAVVMTSGLVMLLIMLVKRD